MMSIRAFFMVNLCIIIIYLTCFDLKWHFSFHSETNDPKPNHQCSVDLNKVSKFGSFYGIAYYNQTGYLSNEEQSNATISIATMCDIARLSSAKQIALNFNGPVSIAIYVDSIEGEVQSKTVCNRIQKYFYDVNNSYNITVSILYPDYSSKYYQELNLSNAPLHALFPANALRNLAVSYINTKYVLMLDVDFTYMSHTINLINDNHVAFTEQNASLMVIPSFAWIMHEDENLYKRNNSYLFNKTQLLHLIRSKSVRPFYDKVWNPAQQCTNYFKWYKATHSYQIEYCHPFYEPYFMFKTVYAKNKFNWDEAYIGRGCNDVQHVAWFAYNCFKFQVMHDMFIIHQYSNFNARPNDQFQGKMRRKYRTHILNNYCDYNRTDYCLTQNFIDYCKSLPQILGPKKISNKQPINDGVNINDIQCELDLNNILKLGSFHGMLYYNKTGYLSYEQQSKAVLTIATHCDVTRLTSIKQIALNFNGPLSIAIYTSSLKSEIQTKTVCSEIFQHFNNFNNKYDILVSVLSPDYSSSYYKHLNLSGAPSHSTFPTNALRNMAFSQITTKYSLMLGADFYYMSNVLNLINDRKYELTDDKVLMVLPSFEWKSYKIEEQYKTNQNYLLNKQEILKLIDSKYIISFHYEKFSSAHDCTNYNKWYNAKRNYKIDYCNVYYEPWFIFQTKWAQDKFRWDNDYIGRGANKPQHIALLAYNCFKFQVMHDMFIIHEYTNSHAKMNKYQHVMENKYLNHFSNNYCNYTEKNYCMSDNIIDECKSMEAKNTYRN